MHLKGVTSGPFSRGSAATKSWGSSSTVPGARGPYGSGQSAFAIEQKRGVVSREPCASPANVISHAPLHIRAVFWWLFQAPYTPPWLRQQLRYRSAHGPVDGTIRSRLNCALPSSINKGNAWWSILETLPTRLLSNEERFEYRFPYLDRNLVEFLFSIPRRQIVEPGRRRSLMRRALKNIVPREILERRRKAYLIRGPINLIRRERDWLAVQFRNLRCVEMGLVDPSSLPVALDSVAIEGDPKWMPYLMRLISFELWLGLAPINIPQPIPDGLANKIRARLPSTGPHDSEIRSS
jgi:hypothetical protein